MQYFFPPLFSLGVTGFSNLCGKKGNIAFATALCFPYAVHLKKINIVNKNI